MSIALPVRWSSRGVLPWAVLGLGAILIVVNLALMVRGRGEPVASAAPATESRTTATLPGTVTLPEGKVKTAALGYEKVAMESLPIELGVPGRIEANQDLQVQVRPRATGVVREVKVALGQKVKKGQTLAVLDSPDVATARLNLRARQRELATARTKADWEKEVSLNVTRLIPELRKRLDEQHQEHPGGVSHAPTAALENESEVMEKHYADRNLGPYRATLMTAAVEFDIAAHEEEKTGGLFKKEIIGEHPAFVAKHNREAAEAKFRGVLATARFDAAYQSRMADQDVKLAESSVIDAAQRLRVLGVPEDIPALLADAGKVSTALPGDEDVTSYTIDAPFDCTVISKSPLAVPSQKIEMNDVLGLADLSNVWVMADIPESEFYVLPGFQEGKIRLNATAYPGRSLEARVLSVGATVDPTTRTVSMLAETSNAAGLLKLGMFVRIILDTANEARGLTVPTGAVVEIEGKKGVFVPATSAPKTDGSQTFAFRPVKLGRESNNRQEIASGLAEGETVVSRNAFILKSELILQSETEEE